MNLHNTPRLAIVTYHYVRELKHSPYPEIKGRKRVDFIGQIEYFEKHYQIISGNELMDHITLNAPLPPSPLLLTFDDGYIDHFTEVYPILAKKGITACFFPPAKCVLENEVLDVNKIHFVLANCNDKQKLVDHIFDAISEHKTEYNLLSSNEYWRSLAKPSRWDPPEIIFCKRILQHALPLELRTIIINDLFNKFVTTDETSFSRELYMTLEQIQVLHREGMHIGCHGYHHIWLDSVSRTEQESEIDLSLSFLEAIGTDITRWIMCYPYGAYNESLLSILKSRNCVAGLTIEVGIATLKDNNALVLPRLNTNDFPCNVDSNIDKWTKCIAESD